MPIEPIKKSNVSEEVFEQMKTLISTGEWKAGEKIQSENDLAKTFGVSRVSIRAALGRLNALGLVVSKQGEGTFVGEATIETCMNSLLPMLIIDHTQLMDVYEFRPGGSPRGLCGHLRLPAECGGRTEAHGDAGGKRLHPHPGPEGGRSGAPEHLRHPRQRLLGYCH